MAEAGGITERRILWGGGGVGQEGGGRVVTEAEYYGVAEAGVGRRGIMERRILWGGGGGEGITKSRILRSGGGGGGGLPNTIG